MEQRVEARAPRPNWLRLVWRWAPLALVLAYVQLNVTPHERAPFLGDRDGAQHFVYALNLVQSGTFSLSRPPGEIVPDAIRTPAYPALVALVLATQEIPAYKDVRTFLWPKGKNRGVHPPILRMNFLLFVAMVVATYAVTLGLTASSLAALLAAALAVAGLSGSAFEYRSEVLTALLLLIHADGLRRLAAAETPRRATALICGLSGGVLVLATASFIVWLYLLILALPLWFLLDAKGRRVLPPRSMAIVTLLMAVVAGSWMTRNLVQVGSFTVSERGGSVMSARAEYDAMSWTDYRAAWKLWPDALYMRPFVDLEAAWEEGWRLNRRQKGSYYERSRHLFLPLYFPALAERSAGRLDNSRALNHEHSAVAAKLDPILEQGAELDDATLQQAALAAMRENWRMHLALVPPLILRGTGLQAPLLLAVLLAISWRRSRPLAVFVAPVLVTVAFLAGLTHFIPRYGLPFMAVTATATAWVACEVVRAAGRRLRRGGRHELA